MIRILQSTYYNGKNYQCGEECPVDSVTEKRWIKNGIAESMERSKFTEMTDEQLSEYAETVNVDISRVRSREAAIAKIEKAEQGSE